MPEPLPVIIDTDPGQDDAVAILLALASPELRLVGISTVAGNVPLQHTTANALRVLEVAGRAEVPVYAGCPRPLVRTPVTAAHVHGSTGLDGCGLPPPSHAPQAEHAVPWLVHTLREAAEGGHPVTLVPIGPLTNLAMALVQAPDIVAGIERIVWMGGAGKGGNITPAAEFNAFADPHAAHVVLGAGVPLVLVPLDVTYQAITTPERLARLGRIDTPVGRAVHGMLSYYDRVGNAERYGAPGSPLHDPLTVAWLLHPEWFAAREAHVAVELTGTHSLGATLIDWWGRTGESPNATVLHGVDSDAFYALLTERLAAL